MGRGTHPGCEVLLPLLFEKGDVLLRRLEDVGDVVFEPNGVSGVEKVGVLAVGRIEVVEMGQVLRVVDDLGRVLTENVRSRLEQGNIERSFGDFLIFGALFRVREVAALHIDREVAESVRTEVSLQRHGLKATRA